jgi:hypothetical protein
MFRHASRREAALSFLMLELLTLPRDFNELARTLLPTPKERDTSDVDTNYRDQNFVVLATCKQTALNLG